ncbi:hypothetical protein GWL_44390 [Herbaspirillum sp. GW103]|nr:hypothetical protein GWL_44390 [Herbaspirillum sp. GW103]
MPHSSKLRYTICSAIVFIAMRSVARKCVVRITPCGFALSGVKEC